MILKVLPIFLFSIIGLDPSIIKFNPFTQNGFHQVWHSGFIFAISTLSSIKNMILYVNKCLSQLLNDALSHHSIFAMSLLIPLENGIFPLKKVCNIVWPTLNFHQRTAKDHFHKVYLNLHLFFFFGKCIFAYGLYIYLPCTSVKGLNHYFPFTQECLFNVWLKFA